MAQASLIRGQRTTYGAEDLKRDLPILGLGTIAAIIRLNWRKVYFGAVPYLDALGQLRSLPDQYGVEDAATQVRYFLANASTWRGETARLVKAELNRRLKHQAKLDRVRKELARTQSITVRRERSC